MKKFSFATKLNVHMMLFISLFAVGPLFAQTVNFPSFSSLPSAQGWTYNSSCGSIFPTGVNLAESSAFSVNSGVLRLSTASQGSSFVDAWYQTPYSINPSTGWTFEARLRVLNTDPPPPTTTQAFSLSAVSGGYVYFMQVADSEVRTFDPPAPGFPVDTQNFHTYAIMKPAGGSTYNILVDGVPVLTQNAAPDAEPDQLLFGD